MQTTDTTLYRSKYFSICNSFVLNSTTTSQRLQVVVMDISADTEGNFLARQGHLEFRDGVLDCLDPHREGGLFGTTN